MSSTPLRPVTPTPFDSPKGHPREHQVSATATTAVATMALKAISKVDEEYLAKLEAERSKRQLIWPSIEGVIRRIIKSHKEFFGSIATQVLVVYAKNFCINQTDPAPHITGKILTLRDQKETIREKDEINEVLKKFYKTLGLSSSSISEIIYTEKESQKQLIAKQMDDLSSQIAELGDHKEGLKTESLKIWLDYQREGRVDRPRLLKLFRKIGPNIINPSNEGLVSSFCSNCGLMHSEVISMLDVIRGAYSDLPKMKPSVSAPLESFSEFTKKDTIQRMVRLYSAGHVDPEYAGSLAKRFSDFIDACRREKRIVDERYVTEFRDFRNNAPNFVLRCEIHNTIIAFFDACELSPKLINELIVFLGPTPRETIKERFSSSSSSSSRAKVQAAASSVAPSSAPSGPVSGPVAGEVFSLRSTPASARTVEPVKSEPVKTEVVQPEAAKAEEALLAFFQKSSAPLMDFLSRTAADDFLPFPLSLRDFNPLESSQLPGTKTTTLALTDDDDALAMEKEPEENVSSEFPVLSFIASLDPPIDCPEAVMEPEMPSSQAIGDDQERDIQPKSEAPLDIAEKRGIGEGTKVTVKSFLKLKFTASVAPKPKAEAPKVEPSPEKSQIENQRKIRLQKTAADIITTLAAYAFRDNPTETAAFKDRWLQNLTYLRHDFHVYREFLEEEISRLLLIANRDGSYATCKLIIEFAEIFGKNPEEIRQKINKAIGEKPYSTDDLLTICAYHISKDLSDVELFRSQFSSCLNGDRSSPKKHLNDVLALSLQIKLLTELRDINPHVRGSYGLIDNFFELFHRANISSIALMEKLHDFVNWPLQTEYFPDLDDRHLLDIPLKELDVLVEEYPRATLRYIAKEVASLVSPTDAQKKAKMESAAFFQMSTFYLLGDPRVTREMLDSAYAQIRFSKDPAIRNRQKWTFSYYERLCGVPES